MKIPRAIRSFFKSLGIPIRHRILKTVGLRTNLPLGCPIIDIDEALPPEKKRKKTHARNVVVVADGLLKEAVANFPGKDGRTFAFKLGNLGHDVVGSHPGLGAADGPRTDGSRFVVPSKLK